MAEPERGKLTSNAAPGSAIRGRHLRDLWGPASRPARGTRCRSRADAQTLQVCDGGKTYWNGRASTARVKVWPTRLRGVAPTRGVSASRLHEHPFILALVHHLLARVQVRGRAVRQRGVVPVRRHLHGIAALQPAATQHALTGTLA